MVDVQRYDIENTDHNNGVSIVPEDYGRFVLFTDYQKLLDQLKRFEENDM